MNVLFHCVTEGTVVQLTADCKTTCNKLDDTTHHTDKTFL